MVILHQFARASGGSRTRNPRITNAVLCQLKLRWRVPFPTFISFGYENAQGREAQPRL